MPVYETWWAEFSAGGLTPPAFVQHVEQNGLHKSWVWTGERVVGPLTSVDWSEQTKARLITAASNLPLSSPEFITEDDEIEEDRRITLELLLSSQEHNCLTCIKDDNCELRNLLREYSVEGSRFGRSFEVLPIDESSDAIVKDPNRCILCGRCVRACDEVAGKHNLSFAYRGSRVIIVAGMNKPWADSDCATCMACVYACPTGALYEKMLYFDGQEWKPRKLYGHYYCDRSHLINRRYPK